MMDYDSIRLTDRSFMQKLQQNISNDYANDVKKRIKAREMQELERMKKLILTGKMPISQAPQELRSNPVMKIEKFCQELHAKRQMKIKLRKPKVESVSNIFIEDTIQSPCEEHFTVPSNTENDKEDKSTLPLKVSEALLDNYCYEDPLVTKLKSCQTVEEMYKVSEELMANMKTTKSPKQEIQLG